MSHEPPRHDGAPPVDEGYWSSLLSDDESAAHATSAAHEPKQSTHLHGESADWQELGRIQNADETLELRVVGFNRGGLLVEWRSLHGFVPASQLLEFTAQESEQARRAAMNEYVGRVLPLRVIELNPERSRLILSERAAQARPGGRVAILNRVQAGTTVRGVVTNLTDFGAFLDLGGLEGLIHISELSWGRVSHPSAILERGQEVEALVLEVDRAAGRIALSAKRLRPDPWRTVEERYTVGSIVDVVITNVVDFGAFASLEEGLEGLIHISELAEGQFLHPRSVVTEGQLVRARILSIDGRARRMGLSLRAAG
ncbi:MAG: S1 RNA-binding domain-containing protein [Chloroflexi bacterium]|nr:S1 RNA-binding domain-containing protein [Chloroflexota bacterium]MBV6437328.1 30S ribosomal protein S1 [Anaerolineae bacterium]MBW7878067.1 S1 RNA-binding domain-containing protein [Anaerolineae bacterium]MCC6565397.1 S1 RNA-binding domain-containing protein [Chloroflexota bacterium]MCO6443562.1 S1 RNA-binding domain-containing protein [Anaerolineae bacterium]